MLKRKLLDKSNDPHVLRWLKSHLEPRGMQSRVAELLDIDRSQITLLLQNKRGLGFGEAEKIAKHLGVPLPTRVQNSASVKDELALDIVCEAIGQAASFLRVHEFGDDRTAKRRAMVIAGKLEGALKQIY